MKSKTIICVLALFLLALPTLCITAQAADLPYTEEDTSFGKRYVFNAKNIFTKVQTPNGMEDFISVVADVTSGAAFDAGFKYRTGLTDTYFQSGYNPVLYADFELVSGLSNLNGLPLSDFSQIAFSFTVGCKSEDSIVVSSNNIFTVNSVSAPVITEEGITTVTTYHYSVSTDKLRFLFDRDIFDSSVFYNQEIFCTLTKNSSVFLFYWTDLSFRAYLTDDMMGAELAGIRSDLAALAGSVSQAGDQVSDAIDSQTDAILNADVSVTNDVDVGNDDLAAAEDAVMDKLPTIDDSIFVNIGSELSGAFGFIGDMLEKVFDNVSGLSSVVFFCCSFGLCLTLIGRATH